MRAAFTHAPVGMIRLGDQGTMLEVNQSFHDLIGRTDGSLAGQDLSEVSHPEDHAIIRERLRELFRP